MAPIRPRSSSMISHSTFNRQGMKMKRSLAAFALMLLATSLLAATDGPNRAARVLAETPGLRTLSDDDGGRVEAFTHGDATRGLTVHRGGGVEQAGGGVVVLGALS